MKHTKRSPEERTFKAFEIQIITYILGPSREVKSVLINDYLDKHGEDLDEFKFDAVKKVIFILVWSILV
jgi:hypothetical protein